MNHSEDAPRLPSVTVVIPFRGKLTLLEKLLDSIAKAWSRDPIILREVIVVWDGPNDPTPFVVDFSKQTVLATRCLFVEAGPARKRNVGMFAARADIALCVDADCTIHPDLLQSVASAFTFPDVHALAVPVIFESPTTLLESATAVMPYRQAFAWAKSGTRQWWAPAATIALRLCTVERLGGFWSAGQGPDRGEDVDLGLRWTIRLGTPAVVTIPSCASLHARETWYGLISSCERAWGFGTTEGLLWPRHPAFRRRRMPPILAAALVSLIASAVLAVFGILTQGLLITGALLFCIWGIAEVNLFRQSGLQPAVLPAGFLLAFLFEMSRTLSLWRAGTLTGGLWFHQKQPAGEWRLLALNGWLLLDFGFLMWMLSLFITGR
jgi:hypothetical protein